MWKSNVKNALQDKHLANAIQQTSGLFKVVNGAMSEYICQMFERDLSAAKNVTDLLSTTHADNTNALYGFAYFRHAQQVKCQRVRKACNRKALLALHASGCHLERPLLVGLARSCHSYTAPTCRPRVDIEMLLHRDLQASWHSKTNGHIGAQRPTSHACTPP